MLEPSGRLIFVQTSGTELAAFRPQLGMQFPRIGEHVTIHTLEHAVTDLRWTIALDGTTDCTIILEPLPAGGPRA